MSNGITLKSKTVTMTSLELVDFINSTRKDGEPELRHADFLAKVNQVLGTEMSEKFRSSYKDSMNRKKPCYKLPKREACLMAMSYSYELQAKVFDRMTELEEKVSAPAVVQVKKTTSDLAPLRQQRAISIAIDNGDKIKARLPLLGDAAMQSIYAGLVNTAAGTSILPLAVLEEKHKSATEIGKMLGVHRNNIGRIANQHNMKTPEYGNWELGEAEFNSSQRETFVYNAKAVARFRELVSSNDDHKVGAA